MATVARQELLAVAAAVVALGIGAGAAVAVGVSVGVSADGGELDAAHAERDLTMAWIARALLVPAVAWVAIGMLAARTRLVRRPGAAAARASWIGSTRPWRARESTLGMLPLDRWLMILVPLALLIATRAVETSFLGWAHFSVVLGAWIVFAAVLRLLLWHRSPWAVIAAVGGVVVLRCILSLAGIAFAGPGGFWGAWWHGAAFRGVWVTLAVALFVWAFVVAGWSLFAQLGARRAVGSVLAAAGAAVAVPATVLALVGEPALLAVRADEVATLPRGLAHLLDAGMPLGALAWTVAVAGTLALAVGLALTLAERRAVPPRA